MARGRRGQGVLASLWGAAGVFLVGFFGSEALFAPGSQGLPVGATLIPSALAALGMFVYLLTQPLGEPEAPGRVELARDAHPPAAEGASSPAGSPSHTRGAAVAAELTRVSVDRVH